MISFKEWFKDSVILELAQFISSNEYASRLRQLGWRINQSGSHYTAFAPDNVGIITWSGNNWNKNWHQVARDLFRFAKGGRGSGGYPDLEFIWQNPFIIPPNFDTATQTIKKTTEKPVTQVWVQKIMSNLELVKNKEISLDDGNTWRQVVEIDYRQDGQGIDIMFDDGDVASLNIRQQILVR